MVRYGNGAGEKLTGGFMGLNPFVHAKAIELGKHVLRMTTVAGSGHPSSALSIMHIVITLMHRLMRWDPGNPWHPGADRLVLPEGHAVPAVYAAYADLGGVVGSGPQDARPLRTADLTTLRETNSPLDGHPNPAEGFPFFDAATGSLGQGLSVGAGLAAAARLRISGTNSRVSGARQVYVLIGDGESREGQIWEAMDFIVDQNLTNVVPIFNCNGQGQADYVSGQQSPDAIAAKATAFGFNVAQVDGHDADALAVAIGDPSQRSRPLAIIARTQKGWGCATLQDVTNHGKPVPMARLEQAIAEVDSMYATLGIPREGAASGQPSAVSLQLTTSGDAPSLAKPALRPIPFAAAMAEAGLSGAVQKNAVATRRAYGAALLALGAVDERIVALDGDVRNSTFSELFMAKYPRRFFECKIAEQNMVSAAVGLAAAGFVPFVSSFAKFLARAYDQIEMAQITRANIKLVGSHAGVSLAADGPSQMSLHDVAYFRSAARTDSGGKHPACVSFHPSDAVAAYHCTMLMAAHTGMCYMRTHRPDVPLLYPVDTRFEIGGSHVLSEGDVVTIVSAGYMVHESRKAVEQLAKRGMHCTLIDAYSFPLDPEPILAHGQRTGGRILCVEDNYIGGLGSELAEAAAARGGFHVASMTCRRLPKSTRTTEEILAYVRLSGDDIAQRAMELARRG